MIVADILMYFLLIMGTYIVMVAYWLAAEALLPTFVDGCRERFASAPWRQFFVGLLIFLPLFGQC